MNYFFNFLTDIGYLTLTADEGSILSVRFGKTEFHNFEYVKTALISTAEEEICAYLQGKLKTFTVPYRLTGTDFRVKVLNFVSSVPYGETVSYKQIAETLGLGKACRAVGVANNKNPLPIIVPCHRVIGADGSLVGYAGGLHVKKYLLNIESRNR